MGRVAWKKTQPPMQDRGLFSRIGILRERVQKIISKEKEVTMDSMLGYFPYTLFQTLTRKGIWQEGAGTLSTAPRLVSERKKEPRDRVTRSLCRRAIKNINYGKRTYQREQERADISTKMLVSSTCPMPINLPKEPKRATTYEGRGTCDVQPLLAPHGSRGAQWI